MNTTKRGRWRKRLFYCLAGIFFLVAGYFVAYLIALTNAKRDLHAAIAEVDTAEPDGWQLENLEARRPPVPDGDNGAKLILRAAAFFPKDWRPPKLFQDVGDPRPCEVLADEMAAKLEDQLEPVKDVRDLARLLVDYRQG